MIRNNFISVAVNLGLGILFFLISVIAYYGGFDGNMGFVSGIYKYYFEIILTLIGWGIFFSVGKYLSCQKSRIRNLISVVAPIV